VARDLSHSLTYKHIQKKFLPFLFSILKNLNSLLHPFFHFHQHPRLILNFIKKKKIFLKHVATPPKPNITPRNHLCQNQIYKISKPSYSDCYRTKPTQDRASGKWTEDSIKAHSGCREWKSCEEEYFRWRYWDVDVFSRRSVS